MSASSERPPGPLDDYDEWPENAQELFVAARTRVHRLKAERDALREKRARQAGDGKQVETMGGTTAVQSLDALTLPWAKYMDGRIHRLKRGKHFTGEVFAVIEEARLAARIAGRGVLQMREQMGLKYQYVWVQFTDDAILLGERCPCGGRKLARLHLNLARCQRCGRTLALGRR